MTYDVLEEQLLSRVQFIEDGTDITAEVRVRGSQEGLFLWERMSWSSSVRMTVYCCTCAW